MDDEYKRPENPIWVTRDEAREMLVAHWLHTLSPEQLLDKRAPRWDRMRNYEIERALASNGFPEYLVGEICPFNDHWCAWGSLHPDGKALSDAHTDRARLLYSVVSCSVCGEDYGGWGKHGPKYGGPKWDGACLTCGHQLVDPPEGALAEYHRTS